MSDRGFVAIPNHIMRDATLPGSALRVFGLILSYAWGDNACTASTPTLCEQAGVGRSAFFEATRTLQDRGLLRIEKRPGTNGSVNAYYPVPTGGMAVPDDESGNRTESGKQPASRPAERTSSRPANRTQKKTKAEEDEADLRSAAAARETKGEFRPFDRPSLPDDGQDLDELMGCLQQLADWAGDQDDRAHRRFASAWIGDAGRVRLLLEGESAAARLEVVDYLLRAVPAGWKSTGVAKAISGDVLVRARTQAQPLGDGLRSREERLSEQDRLERERAAGAAEYFASLRGGTETTPDFDFEAQAIEDDPTNHGDHQ